MRKIFTACFAVAFFVSIQNFAVAQCNPDDLTIACPVTLPEDFTLVKSYQLNPPTHLAKIIEKSYVFTKDMTYMLAMCSQYPNVKVKIFDGERKEVATNLYGNIIYPSIGFRCSNTGIYYMSFSFDEATIDCGAVVLAIKSSL